MLALASRIRERTSNPLMMALTGTPLINDVEDFDAIWRFLGWTNGEKPGFELMDKLDSTAGFVFEGVYALVCGLLFFAVAGLVLAPMLHRLLHRFHLEDTAEEEASPHRR